MAKSELQSGGVRMKYKCSCCGAPCATEEPSQDKGYGFCDSCVKWMDMRKNKELDELSLKIEAALNPVNAAKFRAMDTETRRVIALKAIEDGMVSYSIGR